MFPKPIQITVFLHGATVGQLALTPEDSCAFEYDSGFLRTGQSISPFYLPLKPGVFVARKNPFSGNS